LKFNYCAHPFLAMFPAYHSLLMTSEIQRKPTNGIGDYFTWWFLGHTGPFLHCTFAAL